MFPIVGIGTKFFAKILNFVGFRFKVSSFKPKNENFALYLHTIRYRAEFTFGIAVENPQERFSDSEAVTRTWNENPVRQGENAPQKNLNYTKMKNIRNFCIIAHIDHGKSTLADRLLGATQTVTAREEKAQLLDNMDLERERGITIKSHAIQMEYTYKGEKYILNLIDTPGHVDFSYEVSRSIAACEGALLIVDAAQSIQAQTISNLYLALENDLEIIPVLNKVDLPSANPEEVSDDIIDLLGCKLEDIIHASGKTGFGVENILAAIIEKIPAPKGNVDEPLQALIFDSHYNPFRGIEVIFRVKNGEIRKGQKIKFMATGNEYFADEVGTLKLNQVPKNLISTGDVGYLISGIKEAKEVKVGDTLTDAKNPTTNMITGFEDVKPMVFAGIYPVDTEDYEDLRSSMEKLQLNDASLVFVPESSAALGFGFRCGFLGMLHLEIIQERLEREYDMTVITTVPNVSYHAFTKKEPDTILIVNNPSDLPEPSKLDRVEEPFIKATIITKSEFVGNVMSLCIEKRGVITNQTYLTTERVELNFDMPLAEIVFDFYDRLKTVSKGYASFDYSPIGMKESKLVKLDVLLNAQSVDALSALIHESNAYNIGKKMCEKLRELIPRQQFDIPIQAAIGAKIIARETIKALRKDVTAKCYGGDISRKRKLLEKQKKGKKRMRQVGNVEIPQEAFMAVLKLND
jgi:GTP-binding protein LepA